MLCSILGHDLLPRGSGIVTRRPLELQLHKIEEGLQEYAEFLHLPNTRFTDFSMVRKEIEDETDKTTPTSNQISPVPTHLTIYSPNVVNLTLIDLPGLTNVALEGQPESFVRDIESMILSYIEKPNCIILAITPANQDIANSAAIKVSRKVDRAGVRTYGVLTKFDLMNRGKIVLSGRSCGLRNPWVGIVNCSHEDINSNVDMIAARQREREFFATIPDYAHLASMMGSEHLAWLLSKYLEDWIIVNRIPAIQSFIDRSIRELRAEWLCTTVPSDAGARQLAQLLEDAQLLEEDSVLTARRQGCAERLELYQFARYEIEAVLWSG